MMMRLREDPVVVQAFVRNTPVEKLQLHTGRSWACNYSSGTGQKGAPSTFFNHPRRGTFQTAAAAAEAATRSPVEDLEDLEGIPKGS